MSSEQIDQAEQFILDGLRTAQPVAHRPRAVILTGLEYAGKSALAQRLAKYGYFEICGPHLRRKYDLSDYDLITVMNYGVKLAIQKSVNVVIDAINPARGTRMYLRKTAEDNDGNPVVLFIDVPKRVRLQRREEVDGELIVDLYEMEQSELDYELPTPDENPVILDHESDEDALLRAVGLLPGGPGKPGAKFNFAD